MSNSAKMFCALLLVFCLFPEVAHAATEYATFGAFYKDPSPIGWILAAAFALLAGGIIFFTGGTASPIVVSTGSWIGGMMGFSGAAATNAGLAFLGGGSIASGGFGVVGGTALLTAALSFGTGVVIDYSVGEVVSEYKYSNLKEQSKTMPTLPLPPYKSGPDAFNNAVDILKPVNKEMPLSSADNQQYIRSAIASLEANKTSDAKESSKNQSLLALLYFVSNEYPKAKEHANSAISLAHAAEIKRTLPAFIYATSALYEEKFDFKKITQDYFRYAVLAEPDNPYIQLLFSIYLDRMLLRFNDGYLGADTLLKIFATMKENSLEDDVKVQSYTALMSRYFILLKLEQQRITSLSGTSNDAVRNRKKTLEIVNQSLDSYNSLIDGSSYVMGHLSSLSTSKEVKHFDQLLSSYKGDRKRLASLVDGLKAYQDEQSKPWYKRIFSFAPTNQSLSAAGNPV